MITIVVPCDPPSELLPNARRRLHWRTVAKYSLAMRETATYAALGQRPLDWKTITGPVILTLHADYGRRRRVPDLDGTLGACKNFLDGLADAGIIKDDQQVVELRVTHGKAVDGVGQVSITVNEVWA